MYINEVERLDGFGQEIFSVKVASPGLCFLQLSQNGSGSQNTSDDRQQARTTWLPYACVASVGKSSGREVKQTLFLNEEILELATVSGKISCW